MFDWDKSQADAQQAYGDDGQPNNQSKFSHELIGGAAAFAGFKAFEDHQRKEGVPVKHALAKEVLAGFVGGEVDKLAETKGMDEVDKIRAKREATEGSSQAYDEHYVQGQGADQYDPNQYGPPPQLNQ